MVDQTHMNGRTADRHAGSALRQNVAGLMHDVIALAELQTQLLTIDLRDTWNRSLWPLALVFGGTIVALGAIPVLLLGVGWGLVNGAGWSEGVAFSVTAITALVVAGAVARFGWKNFTSAMSTLSRSKAELADNVRWIKNALQHPTSSGFPGDEHKGSVSRN